MNSAVVFFLDVLLTGGKLIIAPFVNLNILWIAIPVYISWIFAEIFQEKKGTSLGNAISNGTIALWVGIDWARTTVNLLKEGSIYANEFFFAKIALALLMFVYGMIIIVQGVKANRSVRLIGRIRVVSYFVIMLTPMFYDYLDPSQYLKAFLSIALFFPAFYYLIELLDSIIPDNTAITEENSPDMNLSGLDSYIPPEHHNVYNEYGNYGNYSNYNQPRQGSYPQNYKNYNQNNYSNRRPPY